MNCPLCAHEKTDHWHRRRLRDYWGCRNCGLVFVPPEQHLAPREEKAEYDKHENKVDDAGYRRFLSSAFRAIADEMPPGAGGLDFGCGPGPALAAMLNEAGYPTRLYDLYYRPDETVWEQSYDFISLTEVIEHLARPWPVLQRLWAHLHPGGRLVIQTQRVLSQAAFRQWRYLHDPTHIAFYAATTFQWLGQSIGAARTEYVGRDIVVLVKPFDEGSG